MARTLIVAVALMLTTVVLVVRHPAVMMSPGRLTVGHQDLEESCFACHAPFRGPDRHCVECHEPAEIDAGRSDRTGFHAVLKDQACASCHTDHRGRAAGAAVREFEHELLPASMDSACRQCHEAPDDALHRGHAEECAVCHGRDAWLPVDVDHEQEFRFDDEHPPDCRTCHPQSMTEYTCYGCHEHSPREVAHEHREEGIRDFEECADCHRSADEHEAEHRRRRGRGRDR